MRNLLIGILALGLSQFAQANKTEVEFSQLGDTLHFEFKGQTQWDYRLDTLQGQNADKNSTTFSVQVPALLDQSLQALQQLQKNFPALVQSVKVTHDGPDGHDVLLLQLKQSQWQAFDYLTDQPSRLVIDIYRKTAPTAPPTAEISSKKESQATPSELPTKTAKKIASKTKGSHRTPADVDYLQINSQGPVQGELLSGHSQNDEKMSGIFDGGDPHFERFTIKDYEIKEDSIIAAQENYYIQFPMLKMDNGELDRIIASKPVYDVTPKDTDENKMVRLLLTLYKNGRYNVFQKTIEWFYEKYPHSEYDEIVRFAWADVCFAMWMQGHKPADFDVAMSRYRVALEKYPHSLLQERTNMLMGFASLDRGDDLGALRLFQNHVKNSPQSPNRDIARLAIAESYLNLSRFSEASQQYQDIEKDSSARKYQMKSAYLQGDVALQKGDFQKAIELYQSALSKYPEGQSQFPNAYYNQAGAYFQLHKPLQSLNTYLDFLKKYPTHAFAGYAMTRVGELLDMMGADKTRAIGAYLETQFRYGNNPSAVIARLHLLASRMRTMKSKEVEKAIEEITALSKKSKLSKMDQFSTVLISDGYASRGDYEKANSLLVKYYQENPTTADTQLLKGRIVKNINTNIKNLVDKNDFMQALAVHNKYSDTWLKDSDRIDTNYHIGRAFEQAGVLAESEKLYRDTLNKMTAIGGSKAEKERNIFERLPSLDEVQLRLSATNWQLGNTVQAYEHMKAIQHPENLTDAQQVERIQVAASLLEKKGDLVSASRYLVELLKLWKGVPELVADPYLQLAGLEIKQGQSDNAIKSLLRVDQLMQDSQGKVPAETHFKALQRLADLYYSKGQMTNALNTYNQLLQKYESSKPLESVRYKVGEMHFKKGDLQKAAEAWEPLKGKTQGMWYNLAQEQLKNSQWSNEYKKYIQRIPAMSERSP